MFGPRLSRWLVVPGFVLAAVLSTAGVVAQSSPLNVVQSSDGTLYLEQGSNAWTMVPNSISDSDLAALTPSGELDGAIPAAFLGTPGAPTLLQVVQGSDGTFYIAQGTNVWTLVPNQIADADLAALNQVGEVDGTISTPALAAPAQPVAAPATVAPAAPTPTTQAAPPQAVAAPATATPAPVAQGSFLGHQLALEVDYPNWGTVYAGPETLTVGQSSQFNNVSPCPSGCATVTVRVGANTLDFSWGSAGTWPTGQASAYVLTTGPGTPPITSASLTKMSGWGGTPRLSVAQAPGATGNNQIRFDVGGCTYSPATTATITVAFGS